MRKAARRALLLAISTILLLGSLATEAANLRDQAGGSTSTSETAFLSAGFDGVSFSSIAPARTINEYLFGQKFAVQQTILSGGSDTLSIDIPGGWNPVDLSLTAYQLSANQSYSRNGDFSKGYSQGGRLYPNYWTNYTGSTVAGALKAEWNNGTTSQEIYTELVDNMNAYAGDYARWTQLVYVNGTNLTQAKLVFNVSKSPSSLGPGNDGKTLAYAFINNKQVFNASYSSLFTSSVQQVIDVTGRISSLPGTINITFSLGFTGHVKITGGFNGFIYFDDVRLYTNCSVFPQSAALQLNGGAVSGQQRGTGAAHLHGALTTPFIFTSNTTGRIRFKCNSTIGVYRVRSSDLATFVATQGLTVNNNVSKASFFNDSSIPWTLGSTIYTQDVLNVSIPHSWLYSGVIFPNGAGVSGVSPGRVEEYENGSSRIIKINATSIGSYGPNPYIVQATSTNYLGALSTFRKITGDWVPADFFVDGSRIMINATVQGGSSSDGSAYAIFYNASNYNVWRNMSAYSAAPRANGILSFDFAWSSSNVTKSNLISLIKWMNSTEVGANWIPITFDLTPPQVKISLPYSSNCVGGSADITVMNVDAHSKNITLFISGSQVRNWTSPSGTYTWNTKPLLDGPVQVKVTGWDLVDHVNTTTFQVIVDNTPPTLTANLPANYSYVHKTVPLSASFTDLNPKNVTIFLDGFAISSLLLGGTYYWDSTSHRDGLANITAVSWDQAGNLNRTRVYVTVDNTPPTVTISVWSVTVSGNQFTGGNRTINVSCADAYFKNVTLSLDGIPVKTWDSANPSYKWNTTTISDGTYDLSASAWDLAGNHNETILMTVFVDNTAPSKLLLIYPNNGEIFNVTTLTSPISWSTASDSGSGVDHYVLELATSSSFDENFRQIVTTSASYTIPGDTPLSNNTWWWRVYAVDRVGNVGVYSDPRSFQVVVSLVPTSGLPLLLILGIGAPVVAIPLAIIFLRRRRAEPEEYDRKNLMVAYVFSSDGRAMFEHQFKEVKVEPQLVSGFLTAISEMMKEVIGGDKRPLRTIERSDAKILIEFGTIVTGALVAKKSSREYRRRLKAFVNRFEDDYADRLVKWNGDQAIFQAVPEVIEEVFSDKTKVATYPSVTGLEDLLYSEKLSGVAVSVQGKTGSGKTEFCLRYASSLLKKGKPVIIVAASLTPKAVREELENNDLDAAKAEKAGRLIIYDSYSEASGVHSDEKYRFGSPGELNNINIAVSKNLNELKNATIIFDSLSAMIEYSELELAADFIRTIKAKISRGGHTAFFIIDSNAHGKNQLNYILSTMDGEIETIAEATKKGEAERLVSFKRLKGFKVKPGYHEFK